jgi:sugar phosphate isomerase/epimerase
MDGQTMFKNLNAGAIGIRGMPLAETVDLAAATGYSGIDFDIREARTLSEAHGVEHVQSLFSRAGVSPGLWSLPVDWRNDQWRHDLTELPRLAELGCELGCKRTATWCPSWSDELEYADNLRWHTERFRTIAEILREYDCRLGIEFIGPSTMRDGHLYEFIHTLDGMIELAGEIGTGNVGLLLDAWHLYSSGGSMSDLDRISADDIVTVHVSDAPTDTPLDELMDNVRFLPLETGQIDLPGFLRKLRTMGYDGPVTTEPFNARINAVAEQNPKQAAAEVSDALDRLWSASV